MSLASDIIDALHHAGATLVLEEGKTRVRGSRVPDELLAQLKANKPAVMEEWTRRQEVSRDRYGEVPVNAPLVATDEFLTPEMREAVLAYVFRQPRPVHAWIAGRTAEYHAHGVPLGDDEVAACVDALAWQRNTTPKRALEWFAGIEECAANLPKAKKL